MPASEYIVRIEPHGRQIRVAADRPVLEGALAAGLNLPHSCKSGHCSSCRVRLKSGQIVYPGGPPLGLTAQEVQEGHVLLCQARALSDLVVEARLVESVADVEIKTLPCRIERLTPLAADVLQVVLRLPVVESLRFQAGQYIDVLLENGGRRSFSIASPPDERMLELHVRRVPGGKFTQRMFGAPGAGASATQSADPGPRGAGLLGVGSLLRIEGPFGQFVDRGGSAPVVMIAGGTGFAPLKSMLRVLLARDRNRPVHLYWGARLAHDAYEDATVLEWSNQHPQLRYDVVLSEAGAASAPHHRLGLVHRAVLADHPRLDGFDVYAAGPPALIEAIRAEFPLHGARPERLFFDSFDYAAPSG